MEVVLCLVVILCILVVLRIPIFYSKGGGYNYYLMLEKYIEYQSCACKFSEKLQTRIKQEWKFATSWRGKLRGLFLDNHFSPLILVAIKNIHIGDPNIYIYRLNGEVVVSSSPRNPSYDAYIESLGYGKI